MPDAPTGALPHGYTLAELQELARTAARDGEDQAVALGGIAEALYVAEAVPRPDDLIRAGRSAIGAERGPAAAITSYAAGDPAEQVVEAHALRQILPRLTRAQRRCLLAMASEQDPVAAAAETGLPLYRFQQYLRAARARFLQLWHEGDEPATSAQHHDRPRTRRLTAATGPARIPMHAHQVAS